jgi:uncharacterized secreted protein with C-terminal beta-propeller domain
MRNLTKITAGGGLGALGIGTLVASGVLAASAVVVVGDPIAGRAVAASGLTPFRSCTELRNWYVDEARRQVGPYGWDGGNDGRVYAMEDSLGGMAEKSAPATPSSGIDTGVGSSGTGTNTQEAGVDEPDVAKTNGTLLVRVLEGSVIVSDVTGDQPRALSSYDLPEGMYGAELLLVGDRVVVTSSTTRAYPGDVVPMEVAPIGKDRPWPTATSARLLTLDLADPTQPRQVSDQTLSGSILSVRQYGDTVRLVTTTQRPRLDFVQAGQDGLDEGRATAKNRALLGSSSIADWLPTIRDSDQPASAARPLVACGDVLHPEDPAGAGTIAVTGFDATSPEDRSTVAVTADGDTVYSSTDALYVATTKQSIGLFRRFGDKITGNHSQPAVRTDIHEFDLSGQGASYVASGSVRGTLRDRWSMDEYDGHLRLALQTGSSQSFDDGAGRDGANAIVTLAKRGDRLAETGRVSGMGAGEEIKSVRWFDDLAVLVTFRQMDPLYTVDLSDPAHPVLAGELKIPGFSGYLHPIGDGRLLGLGTDAGPDGRARGAMVSLFDLSDLSHPTQTARHTFGADTSLSAVDDPRAFTWLPGSHTGFGQLQSWSGSARFRLARISTDTGGNLSVTTESVPGVRAYETSRVLPLPDGRMLLVAGGTAQTMTP